MRILFIPGQRQDATIARIPNLIRILSKRHEVVGLSPLSLASPARFLDRPMKAAERIAEIISMRRAARRAGPVDIIFASQNRHALPGRLIAGDLGRPLVFDSHGNPKLLCADLRAGPFFRWRNIAPEMKLRGIARRLTTVSEIDRAAYIDMGFDADTIDVIPTCIDFEQVETSAKEEARAILGLPMEKRIILFFATFSYAPNVEAARYINDRLARAIPDAMFVVAGAGDPGIEFAGNVRHIGFVERIGIAIRAADLCVAPIRHGVGIFEKVLLMMAHARPTIVTSLAARGIPELSDGVNSFIARDENEFEARTRAALSDEERSETVGRAACDLIRRKYEWSIYEERLFRAVEIAHGGL